MEQETGFNWQTIMERESSRTFGPIYLYDRYLSQINKLETTADLETLLDIQKFKARVAAHLLQTSNFAGARQILEAVRIKMEAFGLHELDPASYHQALLGLLKCKLYFRKPVETEILAKRLIDPEKIIERKYFRELRYESNRMYWSKRIFLFQLTGSALLSLYAMFSFVLGAWELNNGFDLGGSTIRTASGLLALIMDMLWILGGLSYGYARIYRLLNQDYLSLDLLEIFIVKNGIRSFLMSRFNLRLGYQPELEGGSATQVAEPPPTFPN